VATAGPPDSLSPTRIPRPRALSWLSRIFRRRTALQGFITPQKEAWIVQALVREDGLSQLEVAELLGRHKSWVCRRLALLEKLCPELRQDLEVGLLTPTAAREIARLPAGNQSEVLDVSRREALNGDELSGVVRLL
jgi:ParB-like chromosome segregation protein Spo0J